MIAQALKVEQRFEADKKRLLDENTLLKQELRERYDFSRIIGNSNPMRQVYEQVTQVARTNTTVLLRGESGTGKEMIAHALHYNSLRAGKAFVKVSCAALPDTLIESELFGYEKGAFTGAQARKKGRFELADGGTLFLDEIGDLDLSTQIKLLRVIQEREFMRLGGIDTIKVDVRIIAATNVDLKKLVDDGRFREDLYYRLNVINIRVPPLRERKEDIPLLTEFFTKKYCDENAKPLYRFSSEALKVLMDHHWPGNVRELENVVERAVVLSLGEIIGRDLLPDTITSPSSRFATLGSFDMSRSSSLFEIMDSFERRIIIEMLEQTGWSQTEAADNFRIPLSTLNQKIKRHGIEIKKKRERPPVTSVK